MSRDSLAQDPPPASKTAARPGFNRNCGVSQASPGSKEEPASSCAASVYRKDTGDVDVNLDILFFLLEDVVVIVVVVKRTQPDSAILKGSIPLEKAGLDETRRDSKLP